jgi:signal transduction histidine kinase
MTTKRQPTTLAQRYRRALGRHLAAGPQAGLAAARVLGRRAVGLGLETLDLARLHQGALAALSPARGRARATKRAERFFAEAVTPIEKTHGAAVRADAHLQQLHRRVGRRTVDLAVANRLLRQGIAQRQTVEKALKKSASHYARLMKESRRLQKHLRQLTHQILATQEAARNKISRELHDEVAQTLLGINVSLLALRKEATVNAAGLEKEIASTQRLVGKSVKTMRRFAREFGS